MTRICSDLNNEEHLNEMLLAEHREIKRVPQEFAKRIQKGIGFSDVPPNFVLGAGHVKFFLNKPAFTLNRYLSIHNECLKRGFNVQDYSSNWKVYDNFVDAVDYFASESDIMLVKNRIAENIMKSPKTHFHYYNEKLNKDESIKKLGL